MTHDETSLAPADSGAGLVLIVDDEEPIRANLRRILRLEGYAVCEAADGQAAMTTLREVTPALVICDVMMPHADGFAVRDMMRADSRLASVPLLFLTASAQGDDPRLGALMDQEAMILKPFSIAGLLATMQRLLGRGA
ncbi:MAG: response regulator [Betaproteobacteria bacterium]|nr:response regulator [Betaproteobacteria bacterium]